jgi:hypothetical protein
MGLQGSDDFFDKVKFKAYLVEGEEKCLLRYFNMVSFRYLENNPDNSFLIRRGYNYFLINLSLRYFS